METKFGLTVLDLTSFDCLTYQVTLCRQKSIVQQDFHSLLCGFVAVLLLEIQIC